MRKHRYLLQVIKFVLDPPPKLQTLKNHGLCKYKKSLSQAGMPFGILGSNQRILICFFPQVQPKSWTLQGIPPGYPIVHQIFMHQRFQNHLCKWNVWEGKPWHSPVGLPPTLTHIKFSGCIWVGCSCCLMLTSQVSPSVQTRILRV